jgi:hypothetical protein
MQSNASGRTQREHASKWGVRPLGPEPEEVELWGSLLIPTDNDSSGLDLAVTLSETPDHDRSGTEEGRVPRLHPYATSAQTRGREP